MKWVLVRSRLGTLYVLGKVEWTVYNTQAKQMGEAESVMVAESDDRAELVRFKELTKES